MQRKRIRRETSGQDHHHWFGNGPSWSGWRIGLCLLTRVLAQELADSRISVNELIPGPVETAMDPDAAKWRTVGGPGGEWYKSPADVAPLALFLATQPEVGPTAQSFSMMHRDT